MPSRSSRDRAHHQGTLHDFPGSEFVISKRTNVPENARDRRDRDKQASELPHEIDVEPRDIPAFVQE
jgi:hypothetical protein